MTSPTTGSNGMVCVHDICTMWGELKLPGMDPGDSLGVYGDRSLVLPSEVAVIQEGPVGEDFLEYLHQVEIGPQKVVMVPGDSPVRTLIGDINHRNQLIELVQSSGGTLQFFDVSEDEEKLREMLPGIDVLNPPLQLARQIRSKANLRRLVAELGYPEWCPNHRFVGVGKELTSAIRDTCRAITEIYDGYPSPEFIVLKVPSSASGDGMLKFVFSEPTSMTELVNYLKAVMCSGVPEIIVEAGFRHVPLSIQWQIDGTGRHRVVGCTRQLIQGCFTHMGNIVSSGDSKEVTTEIDKLEMERMSRVLVENCASQGYVGVLGFDFMRVRGNGHHQLYLLECNPRVTASTYLLGLAEQIAGRRSEWTIVMSNVKVRRGIGTFGAVKQRLDGQLFNGSEGILPFNLRCLRFRGSPGCAVFSVAHDSVSAMKQLRQASQTLLA